MEANPNFCIVLAERPQTLLSKDRTTRFRAQSIHLCTEQAAIGRSLAASRSATMQGCGHRRLSRLDPRQHNCKETSAFREGRCEKRSTWICETKLGCAWVGVICISAYLLRLRMSPQTLYILVEWAQSRHSLRPHTKEHARLPAAAGACEHWNPEAYSQLNFASD